MFGREEKKKCFAIGCEVRIPTRLLMCAKHWAMVPKGLQLGVEKHLADWQKGGSPRPYLEVIRRAAQAVATKEESAKARNGVNDATKETNPDRRR